MGGREVVTLKSGGGVTKTYLQTLVGDDGSNPIPPLQDLDIKTISYRSANDLVARFHYLGNTRFISQIQFGLMGKTEILGAVCYSPLSVPTTAQSAFGLPKGNYSDLLEMSRLVLDPRLNGSNAASRLVAWSLRHLRKQKIRAVISYADSSRHAGYVYQACNFTYHGLTAPKADFVTTDGKKIMRGAVKHLEGSWVERTRKHRYVYQFDKSLPIQWPTAPYPKGN